MTTRTASRGGGPLALAAALIVFVGGMVGLLATPAALAQSSTGHGNSASAPGHTKDDPVITTQPPATGRHATGTAGTAGTVTSPQPLSHADQNSGGANGQCPGGAYCSTRNGAASGNGNGNGNAVGKPCAGCVGKADNKNPPGQAPNGTDHNAGYECDSNKGIGQTNPAHTGCTGSSSSSTSATSTSTSTSTTTTTTTTTSSVGTTSTTSTSTSTSTSTTSTSTSTSTSSDGACPPPAADSDCSNVQLCLPTPANDYCGLVPPASCVPTVADNFCSAVLGEKQVRGSATPLAASVPVAVLGEHFSRPASALPFTGLNASTLLVSAVGLFFGGALLVRAGRRRRRSA